MLANITILNGNVLTRPQYITYRASLANISEEEVRGMMARCERGDKEFPPDFPERLYEVASTICEDISRSGGEVDPVIEEQVAAHAHNVLDTIEPEVLPPTPCTETLILEAARTAKLESNGYSRLKEVFQFSDDMSSVATKEDALVTPQDWGALLGFATDLGKKSCYLIGSAVNALEAQGYENVVVQFVSETGANYTTISNYARTCQRVPVEKRVGLYPSVVQEIATKRYDKDEAKNTEIILAMVEEARENKWSCEEARSHANAKLGRETKDRPEEPTRKALSERVKALEAVLHRILANVPASDCPAFLGAMEDARGLFRENTKISDREDQTQ